MVACRLPTTLDVQQVNFNFTREWNALTRELSLHPWISNVSSAGVEQSIAAGQDRAMCSSDCGSQCGQWQDPASGLVDL